MYPKDDVEHLKEYRGEFKAGQRSGEGTLHWKDGGCYNGQWLNDKLHGHGVFTREGYTYTGQYKNGLKDGDGTLEYPYDSPYLEYVGSFLEGMRHGQGRLTYKNEESYNGQWWCDR